MWVKKFLTMIYNKFLMTLLQVEWEISLVEWETSQSLRNIFFIRSKKIPIHLKITNILYFDVVNLKRISHFYQWEILSCWRMIKAIKHIIIKNYDLFIYLKWVQIPLFYIMITIDNIIEKSNHYVRNVALALRLFFLHSAARHRDAN